MYFYRTSFFESQLSSTDLTTRNGIQENLFHGIPSCRELEEKTSIQHGLIDGG